MEEVGKMIDERADSKDRTTRMDEYGMHKSLRSCHDPPITNHGLLATVTKARVM